MARKLFRFTTILAIPALLLGAVLFAGYGVGLRGPGNGWMHAKLFLVLCVIRLSPRVRDDPAAARGRRAPRSDRFYRVFNESAVLLLAGIVILVVVKPF